MARQEVHFGIRTPKPLRDLVELAAEKRGVTASEWARSVLRREAAADLVGEEPYSRERARTRGRAGDT